MNRSPIPYQTANHPSSIQSSWDTLWRSHFLAPCLLWIDPSKPLCGTSPVLCLYLAQTNECKMSSASSAFRPKGCFPKFRSLTSRCFSQKPTLLPCLSALLQSSVGGKKLGDCSTIVAEYASCLARSLVEGITGVHSVGVPYKANERQVLPFHLSPKHFRPHNVYNGGYKQV